MSTIPETTLPEFRRLMALHGIKPGKTWDALSLVMVRGKTAYEAAALAGVDRSVITRANKRLARPICPHCGQPIKV